MKRVETTDLTTTTEATLKRSIIRQTSVMTIMQMITAITTIMKPKHPKEERKVFPDQDQDRQKGITP